MISESALLKLQNGSDVRGVAVDGIAGETVNLLPEAVNRIAAAFAEFLSDKLHKTPNSLRLAVGHDSRISAAALQNAVCQALTALGVSVFDCGLASTPAMFMSIVFPQTQMDGSIMITASHLPYNRNGMKFFTADGGLEKTEITDLLKRAGTQPQRAGKPDQVQTLNLMDIYAAHLRKAIADGIGAEAASQPLAGMHIVVDAGNGSGGFFATRVLAPLGADTSGSQFLNPDGMFPNHIPNPENDAAMASIRQAVLNSHADLGLIFDTDVDRMSAVLPNGETISRNALIAMMAAILAPDYPGSVIVTDSVTSDELTDFLTHVLHLVHHRYKRGYKNVIDECIRLNHSGMVSPLAIETSGHGALKENYYLDDGAYLAVKLIIAAAQKKRQGGQLADLIADLHYPLESQEYRIKVSGDNPAEYGTQVLQILKERAENKKIKIARPSYEGVRLVFPHGWALLRMSLHDPNMPLNVESREKGGVRAIAAQIHQLLQGLDRLDTSVLPE